MDSHMSLTMQQQYNRLFQDEQPTYLGQRPGFGPNETAAPVYGPSIAVTHPQFVNINRSDSDADSSKNPKSRFSKAQEPRQGARPFPKPPAHSGGNFGFTSASHSKVPDPVVEMGELQHQRLEEYTALQQQLMMHSMNMDPFQSYLAQMQMMSLLPAGMGMGYGPGMGMGMGGGGMNMGMGGMMSSMYGMMDPGMMTSDIDMLMGETMDGTLLGQNGSVTNALQGAIAVHHEKGQSQDTCPCIHCAAANQLLMTPARSTVESQGLSPDEFTPHSVRSFETPPRRPNRDWAASRSSERRNDVTPSERRQPLKGVSSRPSGPKPDPQPTAAVDDSLTQANAPDAIVEHGPFNVTVVGHFGRKFELCSHHRLSVGDHVVFEGDRGIDLGVVCHSDRVERERAEKDVAETSSARPRKEKPLIIRRATTEEVNRWSTTQREEAAEAAAIGAAGAKQMGLPFTIQCAAYQFDRKKLTFFYESDGRVDFRRFLPEMYNRFRCRIWFERADDIELHA